MNVLWELCPVESSAPVSPIDDRRQTDSVRPRLVCVLDASLSMRESYGPDERLSKIDRVKIFVQLLVKTMSNDDWLGIVTFGADARVVLPLQRLTEEVKVTKAPRIDLPWTKLHWTGVRHLCAWLKKCQTINMWVLSIFVLRARTSPLALMTKWTKPPSYIYFTIFCIPKDTRHTFKIITVSDNDATANLGI